MPSLQELGEATGPELWPQKPGQCLLSGISCAGLSIAAREGFQIWIANLYLREGVTNAPPLLSLTISVCPSPPAVWHIWHSLVDELGAAFLRDGVVPLV